MSEVRNHGAVNTFEGDIQDWADRIKSACANELQAISDSSPVLDLCCGEGGVSRRLLPNGNIIGIEYSKDRCRRGKGMIQLLCGDACQIPLQDSSVSMVLFFEGIEHLSYPGESLKEIQRVLMEGGKLLISTPNRFWISLRRVKDYGKRMPDHVKAVHLQEWSFDFPKYVRNHGFHILRKTSPDPIGMSLYRMSGIQAPECIRWLTGCSQLLVAEKV